MNNLSITGDLRRGHGQEVIPFLLPDGHVTFVPVLEEAPWPAG